MTTPTQNFDFNAEPGPHDTDGICAVLAAAINRYGGSASLTYNSGTQMWVAYAEGEGMAAQPGVPAEQPAGPTLNDALNELYQTTWWIR